MNTTENMCFACGPHNPVGLKLTFHEEGDEYVTSFTAAREYQGYEGMLHGGIIATLLDEIMARHVWAKHGAAATAKLTVQYRRPVPTDVPLDIRGRILGERRNGHAFETAAAIRAQDGTVLAQATGLVILVEL